jgi:predicted nucleic acid-binding protein
MRAATFDSSFWVHAVYLDLIEFLLSDFELMCAKAVESELGRDNPTSRRLKELLTDKSIKRAVARSEKINLYGDGERAAINLALERKLLLLIDDWRPYEAAQAAGLEVVNSIAYLVGLYEQSRITSDRAMQGLVRMTRRGTLRPEWIHVAARLVAQIRRKGDH